LRRYIVKLLIIKRFTMCILAALAIVSPSSQAALIYGVQHGNPNLVTVNSVSGIIKNVGLLPGGNVNDLVQGLTGTASGNLLYTDGNQLAGVNELNPLDGSLIANHTLLGVINRGGLSFDTPSNTLYSIHNGSPLVSQAGLGGAVNMNFTMGHSPFFPGAMGGDDNGRLFSHGNFNTVVGIHEFNLLTGAFIMTLPSPSIDLSGLAFDGTVLYASDTNTNQLWTLNANTGAVIHQVAYTGGALTALASLSVVVPEPGTLALFGISLAGFGFFRRHKRR
jgi:outer membrane protein assembly factor BamB